jgi:hypothetical protein
VLACCLLLWLARPATSAPESVQYDTLTVNGVYVHRISVDLNDQSLLVTPLIATDSEDGRATFRDFLDQNKSLAQITGTFFDLHTGTPIGDVVIRGEQQVWSSGIGSALVVTPENKPAIIEGVTGPGAWKGYESVLEGGLRLVRDGVPAVDPAAQGFHDRYMMRNTARIAVGVLPQNRIIMVETGHVLLPGLADLMIALGCTDAMALDGGGSTSIAYDGKVIMATSRRLANVLAVVQRTPEEIAARQEAARQKRLEAARALEEPGPLTLVPAISRLRLPAAGLRTPLEIGFLILYAGLGGTLLLLIFFGIVGAITQRRAFYRYYPGQESGNVMYK